MSTTRSMISFDWAMKRLLRNKANFEVLEGFLSELLRRKIIIRSILESESNPTRKDDKTNAADILVEADNRELVIIELQYDREDDYFQRMLYGVSKSITDHIDKGNPYSAVCKVYSVNIVYFDLGVGGDYIYHGTTVFTGLHTEDELLLTAKQQELYGVKYISELHPEYYIIKVRNFDDVAKDTIDEWIFYLKNNQIRDEFKAQGIDKARELLAYDNLSDEEKWEYQREAKIKRIRDSEVFTAFTDGEIKGLSKGEAIGLEKGEAIGLEKGEAIGLEKGETIGVQKKAEEVALKAIEMGMTIEEASILSGLSPDRIAAILKLKRNG
jgi:predicted transposase/invertase (TIGR01784 family)